MQKVQPDHRDLANPDLLELAEMFGRLQLSLAAHLQGCSEPIQSESSLVPLVPRQPSTPVTPPKSLVADGPLDIRMLQPPSPEARQVRKPSYGTF